MDDIVREQVQFKTVEDLRAVISDLIIQHREAKRVKLGVMFRVVIPPNTATLYEEDHQGPGIVLVEGVRVGDYKFETSSALEWVIPCDQSGLSFSRTWSHLKDTRNMLKRFNKIDDIQQPTNVGWWILDDERVPKDMKFVLDKKKKNHYFLTVTKRMHISDLVSKLEWVAQRMSIIKDLTV